MKMSMALGKVMWATKTLTRQISQPSAEQQQAAE
tara:strand:- start:193 stop:294 length:102 start_codon:yes stop_codon:yes gene_type:complete